jgi:hypothetical protein
MLLVEIGQRVTDNDWAALGSAEKLGEVGVWMIFRSDESARFPKKHSSLVPSHRPVLSSAAGGTIA